VIVYVGQDKIDDILQVIKDSGNSKIITRPDNKGMRITLTK